MLYNNRTDKVTKHHYHRITRKLVIAFGTMFNHLRMVRYAKDGITEVERINVPLMYASKEKFYQRITAAPDNYNPVNVSLPRMAFEMNGIHYDPLRKKSNFIDTFAEGLPTGLRKVKVTPYNFDFNLYVFVRNTEDGMQIVEQILPYFTPDYTVTIDFVGVDKMKQDVPIVFNSITYDDSHEGDPESTRSIVWTLNFTVKAYLFGPINDVKSIEKATANVSDGTFETNPLKKLILGVDGYGRGSYKQDELVYQGASLEEASSTGFVKYWSPGTSNTANTIILYDTNGSIKTNKDANGNNTLTGLELKGAVSGAKYNVSTLDLDPNQLISLSVEGYEPDANGDLVVNGIIYVDANTAWDANTETSAAMRARDTFLHNNIAYDDLSLRANSAANAYGFDVDITVY